MSVFVTILNIGTGLIVTIISKAFRITVKSILAMTEKKCIFILPFINSFAPGCVRAGDSRRSSFSQLHIVGLEQQL
jgi:hypothetical protein